jgi:uncharacterized protein YkwD
MQRLPDFEPCVTEVKPSRVCAGGGHERIEPEFNPLITWTVTLSRSLIRSRSLVRRTLTAAAVVLASLVVSTIGPAPQSASAATSTENYIAVNVFYRMNAERQAHGLPQLRMYQPLLNSASAHNSMMARYNTLSHQLPGEASLGARISATGYHWTYIGENIAWNSEMDVWGALAEQTAMYNETAPNNGHRLNILSSRFVNVGVAVLLDTAHHKLWLTEDFGR